MSIKIERLKSANNSPKLQFLPAKIQGDGVANVKEYFNTYNCKEQDILTNALRGYLLVGEVLKVPGNYKGLVVQETRKPLNENAHRALRVKGSFKDFVYWNYDKNPSKSDVYKQALQLLQLVEVLSHHCTEVEVLKEMEKHKTETAQK